MSNFDRRQYMRNFHKAKQCRGCKWLHIGRGVDHNHCDSRGGDSHWQDHRVNGHFNYPNNLYYKTECLQKEDKPKLKK